MELRYQSRKAAVGDREVTAFTQVVTEGGASNTLLESLVAFALSEVVRRDGRISIGTLPELNAFLRNNPAWMPYVSPY